MPNFREESRKEWVPSLKSATREDIQTGCLQRIADATELMAQNYTKLLEERDRFLRWYRKEREGRKHLERRIAALKGVITRMKKKACADA